MIRRGICGIALALLFVTGTAFADGVRSIGLRLVLPIGRVPLFLGVEATADVPFGVLNGMFALNAAGQTLITGSYDLQLQGDVEGSKTFLRLTAGLSYLERGAFLPALVFGGGLALEVPLTPALSACPAAEFLFPIALPLPTVSLAGRWMLP